MKPLRIDHMLITHSTIYSSHLSLPQAPTHTLQNRALPLLEFDLKNPDAQVRYQKVLEAWFDMLLISGVVKAVPLNSDPNNVLDHYFNPDDSSNVADVFENIMGANTDGTGSDALKNIPVFDADFDDVCKDTEVIAYMRNVEGSNPPRGGMHFCPQAYKYPLLRETKCELLEDVVSGKMSTFAGIIIHELM